LAGPSLIITEVMFDPIGTDTQKEWFEVFNASGATLDLSGYYVRDNSASGKFTFNAGSIILPGETIVIARNISGFMAANPGVTPYAKNFTFALNNGGDILTLFDDNDTILDQMAWGGLLPGWDIDAAPGETLRRISTGNSPGDWLGGQSASPGGSDGLSSVSEPASLLLFGFGAGALASVCKQRKSKRVL